MVRFTRSAIGQIGDGELDLSLKKLLRAPDPERLQVTKVTDVLLDRPGVLHVCGKHPGREGANPLFNARRAAAEPFQDIWKEREGEVKRKPSLKPRLQGTHSMQDRKRLHPRQAKRARRPEPSSCSRWRDYSRKVAAGTRRS
jgi:hypothetical protein